MAYGREGRRRGWWGGRCLHLGLGTGRRGCSECSWPDSPSTRAAVRQSAVRSPWSGTRHERTSAERPAADIQFKVTIRLGSTLLRRSEGLSPAVRWILNERG